jgi:hypothetical protein
MATQGALPLDPAKGDFEKIPFGNPKPFINF